MGCATFNDITTCHKAHIFRVAANKSCFSASPTAELLAFSGGILCLN